MVDKSLKLYNGSDLLPVNDYTDEDWTDWSQTELAMAADGGDSTASTWQLRDEGGVIPDRSGDYGSYFLEAHNVVKLTVGSNTLFRGRLGYDDRKQGRQPSAGVDTHSNKGRAVEFTVTLADVNDDLRGIIVHAWSRPEETDVARVQALVAAYLSGNPRPSTNLNGSNFVVTGSNTFTVPAKTYYGVTPGEVLQEIAELTDKQMFVDVDENLHYHGNDYGWNAPIRISDDPADLNAITCAPIDASRAEESRDTLTALRAYWGNTTSGEQNTFQRTDTTKMAINDYWEDVFFDSESTTWAEASNRASNYFVPRKLDQTSYTVTIGKPGSPNGEPWTSAEIALAPKAGQLIDFKALKARGGRTDNHTWIGDFFLNRRIKEVRWTFPTADGFYCQLTLDRPRHSLLGGTPFHKPSPPDTGTPGTPPTAPTEDYRWSFTDLGGSDAANLYDDGTSTYYWFSPNWETGLPGTAAWHDDYDAHMTWGHSGAKLNAHIPITVGETYTFSTDMSQRQSDSNAWMRVEWYNAASAVIQIDYIAGPGVSVAAKASYSKVVTAPTGATKIDLHVDAATGEFGAADNIVISHGGSGGTAGTPGTSPVTTVGGTGSGTYSDSTEYVPVGSVLELQYIDTGGPYIYAGGISVADAGDYFLGTDVEAVLQEIGAGLNLTIETIDPSGASQDLDVSAHSVFEVHLDADCSITFTGMVTGRTNRWWVHVFGDGTHVADFPDVLWPDSTAPTFDATADSHWLEFVSTDALNVYGDYGGAAGAGVTFGTPALTLGTANAAGSTDEAIRRDATILAFDATAPVTQAYSDTAAAGTATVAARRDHKHGMPAAGGVTEIADLPTAETDTALVLHPDGAGGIAWGTDATGGGGASNLASGKVTRSAGDFSLTGSTAFTDVTGASITITTGARKVMLTFAGSWYVNNTAGTAALDFTVDGTRVGGSTAGLTTYNQHSTANEAVPCTMVFLTDALSAGSHTFKVQAKVFNAAHTLVVQGADPVYSFAAVEMYA